MRNPTERVLGGLLAVAAAEFVVLAVTGLYLVFFYRPSGAQAWKAFGPAPAGIQWVEVVRVVHRLTSVAMVLTVIAVAVVGLTLVVGRWRGRRRHRATAGAAVGIAVVGVLASFTGYLLPWDQLALWAVTVGSNMNGFRPIFQARVQYVLIGGSQISVGTLRSWFVIHVLLVPLVLLALGGVMAWRLSGRQDLHERHTDGHTGLGS